MPQKDKKTMQAEAVERTGADTATALEGTPGMFPGDAATFGSRAAFASMPSEAPAPLPSPTPSPAMPYQSMTAWEDPALSGILGTPVPGVDYDPRGVPEPLLEAVINNLGLGPSGLRGSRTFLGGGPVIYDWVMDKFK